MMTDKELLTHLATLAKKQAATETDIIAHLIGVERRSLHLKKAYKSLFQFVFEFLKCSEATASRRITVTRAAIKFPVILDMLRAQRVTLSSVTMIASHLTNENHLSLLQKIAGSSKRQVERLIASFSPTKGKRDIIRPIVVSVPKILLTGESKSQNVDINVEQKTVAAELGEALALCSVSEKTTHKVRIAFDAPADLAERIERIREIHAHKLKDGSLA